jgi:hypothetical protein
LNCPFWLCNRFPHSFPTVPGIVPSSTFDGFPRPLHDWPHGWVLLVDECSAWRCTSPDDGKIAWRKGIKRPRLTRRSNFVLPERVSIRPRPKYSPTVGESLFSRPVWALGRARKLVFFGQHLIMTLAYSEAEALRVIRPFCLPHESSVPQSPD